jgi:hypothetical protein
MQLVDRIACGGRDLVRPGIGDDADTLDGDCDLMMAMSPVLIPRKAASMNGACPSAGEVDAVGGELGRQPLQATPRLRNVVETSAPS